METKHDFQADNKFFIDNYGTLLDLYLGKTIVVADDRILFVAENYMEALSWTRKFRMAENCSVLEVSPKTYVDLTEGIRI